MTQAAVIVAGARVGGTFLSHALSNHPQVFCDRGEPLHEHSPWQETHASPGELLRGLLAQEGYQVSMCKLQYGHLEHRGVRDVLLDMRARVVHLTRENKLRQAISLMLNKLARRGRLSHPQHSFEPVRAARAVFEPRDVLAYCRDLDERDRWASAWLEETGLPLLHLTYAGLMGGEGHEADEVEPETARALCDFLGVRPLPLACGLRRVNAYPLAQILVNWDEVRAAVADSEFEYCLADEDEYGA